MDTCLGSHVMQKEKAIDQIANRVKYAPLPFVLFVWPDKDVYKKEKFYAT